MSSCYQLSCPNCSQPIGNISDRELEVMRLVGMGFSNKEIADDLTITVKTVKNHISAVIKVTGASNRWDAYQRSLAVEVS